MGLDMYLNKQVYVGGNWEHNKATGGVDITTEFEGHIEIPAKEVNSVLVHVAYWRKANAIHQWFVDHVEDSVDDCRPIEMYGEELIKLRDLCQQILDAPEENRVALAEEMLPTQSGFFFGSTDYDEYYFQDLKDTVEQLKDIDPEAWYIYQASW